MNVELLVLLFTSLWLRYNLVDDNLDEDSGVAVDNLNRRQLLAPAKIGSGQFRQKKNISKLRKLKNKILNKIKRKKNK